MRTLLDFLKEDFTSFNHLPDNKSFDGVNKVLLDKINKDFEKQHLSTTGHENHNKVPTVIESGQIWTVKESYIDFAGNDQRADHPILVIVVTGIEDIAEEKFIRVQVVSPFVEFCTPNDLLCEDTSIVGFPFLIETWNEQPMLVELLDQYFGSCEIQHKVISSKDILTNEQAEFRFLEVSRSAYLNNSISSLLFFLENQQAEDGGVVISMFGQPRFPQFFIGERRAEHTLSLAAKKGTEREDRFLKFSHKELPFEIQIRKNEDGYILTISPFVSVTLRDTVGRELEPLQNLEKVVFHNLSQGIYELQSSTNHQSFKIRLK